MRVCEALKKHHVPYAIVGGYAVALHGAVRGTLDVDLITSWKPEHLLGIKNGLAEIGLVPRLTISVEELFAHREHNITEKNLIAWNFINHQNPAEQVDIITTHDLADVNTLILEVNGTQLSVISKTDLIDMKTKSARDQDLVDVAALKKIKL